jgi:hypothetical protein
MTEDDELTALAAKVVETFGEDALAEAYVRVLTAAPPDETSTASLVTLFEMTDDQAAQTKAVDPAVVHGQNTDVHSQPRRPGQLPIHGEKLAESSVRYRFLANRRA